MRINKYINEERQAKLQKEFPGISPAAAIDILIDNLGENNNTPAPENNPALEIMINSNASAIDEIKEEISEIRNNIDTILNDYLT